MSKLDDILDDFDAEINVGVAWPQAKQQIKELFLELIEETRKQGTNATGLVYGNELVDKGFNKFKNELCQRVEGL